MVSLVSFSTKLVFSSWELALLGRFSGAFATRKRGDLKLRFSSKGGRLVTLMAIRSSQRPRRSNS